MNGKTKESCRCGTFCLKRKCVLSQRTIIYVFEKIYYYYLIVYFIIYIIKMANSQKDFCDKMSYSDRYRKIGINF